MASTPNTAVAFQPFFKRVPQEGRHDDTFAVIATLTGKSLDSVFKQAEALGLPKTGPFFPFIDSDMIAKLLVSHGLVATVWKECTSYHDLGSEVAIACVDYNADWEIGRCVLYHRNTAAGGKTTQPYVIDPYPHADSKLHLRVGTTELAKMLPSWYIGVTQANKPAGK